MFVFPELRKYDMSYDVVRCAPPLWCLVCGMCGSSLRRVRIRFRVAWGLASIVMAMACVLYSAFGLAKFYVIHF